MSKRDWRSGPSVDWYSPPVSITSPRARGGTFRTGAGTSAFTFGETTAGHVVYWSDGEYPQIYSVAKHRKANRFQGQVLFRPWSGWHTDITAAINPPAASMLRGETVPPYGGDTQFTNLVPGIYSFTCGNKA